MFGTIGGAAFLQCIMPCSAARHEVDTANEEKTMAQIANRGSERDEVNEAADAAKETTDRTIGLTREAAGRTAGIVKEATDRVGDSGRRVLDGSMQAADASFKAESELARLWLEITSEQLRHNAETFQRLAGARDWRQALEIQNAFVQESLSRMAEGVSRHLDLTGSLATRLLDTGRSQMRRAA
jgi:hypothetical protein